MPIIGWTAGFNPPGFPPFSADEYKPAGLSPKEPEVMIEYPGGAITRGIATGKAVVTVLVEADGKPTDFLMIGCTDKSFGMALLESAKTLKYQAAKFKGVAVPARYDLGYEFRTTSVSVDPMEAARLKMEKTSGVKMINMPVMERELDQHLEFTNAALPQLPEGIKATEANPVKVSVTFYVDETGHVRAPHVESAIAPELIPGAIQAVLQWSFKPPLFKGKPTVVFAGRQVRFVPRQSGRVRGGRMALAE